MILLQLPIIRKDEKGTHIVNEIVSLRFILRISPTPNGTTNIWMAYSGINLETPLSYSEVLSKLSELKVIDDSA